MFYLVQIDEVGRKLVGCSEEYESLAGLVSHPKYKNAAQAVIYSDKALRAAFLVDGTGEVAVENGYLVDLDSL